MYFFKNWHVQKIQKCKFLGKKKTPEAQRRTELPQKKQHQFFMYIYIYIYIYIYTHIYILVYIHIYLKKSNTCLLLIYPFIQKSQKVTFSQFEFFLVTFFHIRTIFYWTPKWSVWSIGTFWTAWIWRFVTQKVGLGRKVKIDIFKNGVWKAEIDGFGTQNGVFWEVPEMQIVPKYILDSSDTIPAQFSYMKPLF